MNCEDEMSDDMRGEIAEWVNSTEGRAWRWPETVEWEKQSLRAEQERMWQMERPLEWVAWQRLRPLLRPEDRAKYDFPDFLKEVGLLKTVGISPDQVIVDLKDEGLPYRPGNLRWSSQLGRNQAPTTAEYLTLNQVGKMTQFSYDYVYDAVQNGDLVAYWKGRQWRVKPADAHAWMEQGRKTASPVPRSELGDKVSRYFRKRTG